jgi:hypothetical protein
MVTVRQLALLGAVLLLFAGAGVAGGLSVQSQTIQLVGLGSGLLGIAVLVLASFLEVFPQDG